MSHCSLVPERCYWCEIGKIEDHKCLSCGATYGSRLAKKKKKNGFILPAAAEIHPYLIRQKKNGKNA